MITTKANKYCAGDVAKIQNFHKAAMDPTQVWFIFHRNLITGVGRINATTLKALGKFYHCRPEELVFLKKQDIRKLEDMFQLSNYHGNACHAVFKFWKQLHPDKLFLEVKDEEFKVLHRSIRRLRILYNQMKARCHNPNA